VRDPIRAQSFVPDTGHGPGVLVLAAGANGDALVREAGMRLARHGFVAFGPELPAASGDAPSEAERRAVDAGIERLFNEHASEGARIGIVGFGRGALLARDAAERGARVAVVAAIDEEGAGFADPSQPDRYDADAARAGWDAAIARLRAEL
jgi:dienelactone hydrolase